MRFALLLALLSVEVSAQGRIYNRGCDVSSRRSTRGGVACRATTTPHPAFTPDAGAAPRVLFADNTGAGMGTECAGADVTTPDGGALTVVRTDVAECIYSNGQRIAQVAANKPRIMTGAVDRTVLGVMSEQTARENLTKNNRDGTAAAWVATNMDCTRTAGMRNADASGATRCCATAANGTLKQTILTASGGEQVHSWFLKRATGTGAVNLSIDGSTWLANIGGSLSASLWKRAVPTETVGCTAVNGGTSLCIVQAGLFGAPNPPIQSLRIVTSGDCVDFDFAQVERAPNGIASTPIENPSTSYVTRPVETIDLGISGTYPTQYCVAATLVRSSNGAGSTPTVFPRYAGVIGDGTPGDLTGSSSYADIYVNTSTTNVLTTDTTVLAAPSGIVSDLVPDGGTIARVSHYWNQTNVDVCLNGFCADGVDNPPEGAPDSDPYTPPTWTRYRLGGYNTTNGPINGVMSEVQSDPASIVCQRALYTAPSGFGASIGDSISAHPAGVPGWINGANQLWLNGSRLQTASLAKGGAYTGPGLGNNNLTYQYDTFVKGQRYGVLFALGGVNDILSGLNMTTALANLTAIWDDALARGMDVHPMTLTPCSGRSGWNGTKQTQLETLNTAIRNYCAAHNLVCVDLYNSVLRDGTALAAAYDSGDGLHPNAAGEAVISSLVVAAHP